MARIIPPSARFEVESMGGVLRIDIPTKKNIFLILFLGFWLCGWLMGEIFAVGELVSNRTPASGALFLMAWLGGWTVGGLVAIYAWLNLVSGREVVQLDDQGLSITREVLGWGRPKEFDLTQVADLRVQATTFNPADWQSGLQFWGVGGGVIAFDYGAKTYRFGAGMDEAEGKRVVAHMHQWIRERGRENPGRK